MINTYSRFYYGLDIYENNSKIDFDEGSGELTATLDQGSYTPTEMATHIAEKLNDVGSFTYTCTFNRSTRILTITSSSSVEILFNSGTNAAQGAYTTLGYSTAADVTNTTFTAAGVCCSQFLPQFKLQSYVPPENMIEQLHSTVNETITGRQELVTYGDMEMCRFNLMFITNIAQPSDGPIINNATGVSDALNFLKWINKKNKIEFMPDTNTVATFMNLVLDSSVASKNGTTVKLKELYDRGLNDYFESETLTFRKVD